MNGDHVKASLQKSLLSSCSFPAAPPNLDLTPQEAKNFHKSYLSCPGSINTAGICSCWSLPALPGQGLAGHRGWRRHAVPGADTALCAKRGRTGPGPAPTLAGSRLAGVQGVRKGSPSPLPLPSAAALTSGQCVTSSCPHSPPAAWLALRSAPRCFPTHPSPAVPSPQRGSEPSVCQQGGGGSAGTQPGPACRCLPEPTSAARLAQRRQRAPGNPGLGNCASTSAGRLKTPIRGMDKCQGRRPTAEREVLGEHTEESAQLQPCQTQNPAGCMEICSHLLLCTHLNCPTWGLAFGAEFPHSHRKTKHAKCPVSPH